MIDLIDLAIFAATLIGLANGYRRGFWLSLSQYLGLVVGVLLGALAAKPALDYLQINNPVARPLGAVLVLVIGGSLGSSIGFAAGEPIRRHILRRGDHPVTDSIGGAVLSAVAVLIMCWFLGISFSRGPSQEVAQQIQKSFVLHVLDSIDRTPPPFMASVESIISGVSFPPVFAGLEPTLPGPLPIPASVNTDGISHAAQSVVKVRSLGCGGLVTGSGFPVGDGYIITNAHVVSGTSNHVVIKPDGTKEMPATVIFFDAKKDVAVLSVPEFLQPKLPLGSAGRGTEGAVIGYPGGRSEAVVPAIVDGAVAAQGYDIYNRDLVTREIYVLQAKVRPGNSGGPLVDVQGRVLGLVFATSAGNPDQAYALTDDEIAGDIQQALAKPTPTDTSQFQCAA